MSASTASEAEPQPLLLEQRISYTYERPIQDLRHRLIVLPREEHGPQRRGDFRIAVSEESAEVTVGEDAYGNCVVDIEVPSVQSRIDFSAWSLVTRGLHSSAVPAPQSALDTDYLLRPTTLTKPDLRLTDAARELGATTRHPIAIAEMACAWVRRMMTYEYGVTDVRTSAATALAAGRGVCQDFAHIMLAICRAALVPARYVSGHLVGEGGSHAWVEIVHATPDGAFAVGFDPTHDRRIDDRYLTIAVGSDYSAVAPTSGTYNGRGRGQLHSNKRLRTLDEAPFLGESLERP